MPCVNCNKSSSSTQRIQKRAKVAPVVVSYEDCDFTKEQVQSFQTRLFCIRGHRDRMTALGLTKAKMNKFLGITKTIITYNVNPCKYESILQEISQLLLVASSLNICPQ